MTTAFPFVYQVGGIHHEGDSPPALPRGGSGLGLAQRALLDGALHPHGLPLPLDRGAVPPSPPLPAQLLSVFHSLFGCDPRDRTHRFRLRHLEILAQHSLRCRLLFPTLRLSLFADVELCFQNCQLPSQIMIYPGV